MNDHADPPIFPASMLNTADDVPSGHLRMNLSDGGTIDIPVPPPSCHPGPELPSDPSDLVGRLRYDGYHSIDYGYLTDVADRLAATAHDALGDGIEYVSRAAGEEIRPSDLRVTIDGRVFYLGRSDGQLARDLGPCGRCGHLHDHERCMDPVFHGPPEDEPSDGQAEPCGCPRWHHAPTLPGIEEPF